jgi:hypothetical protein
MRHLHRAVLGLVGVILLGGSLALLGCGGDDTEDASPINTNNRTFAFANGVAFNPNLNNVPVNLTFLNNSTVFDLQVPGAALRRATGTNIFSSGSCILSVGPNRLDPSAAGGGSSFPVGFGPQPSEVLNFTTCEFDTEDLTLRVESNFGEGTSSPAIPTTITNLTSGN